MPQKVAAMTQIRRATILINPAARGVRPGFDGAPLVRDLARQGVEATVSITGSPEEGTQAAAAAAARGDDVAFVIGGDGSLRTAAAGLAHTSTALAAIPAGTVNVFARETGIPDGLRAAVDSHLTGQRVRMDLGNADGQRFLLMAGIGWDAEIVRRVPSQLKRYVGDFAYIIQGARMLPGLRPRNARWTFAGSTVEEPLALMVLGNTRLYGGRIDFTPRAFADDGSLDMVALCPERLWDGVRLAAKLAARSLTDDRHVIEQRVATISLETPGLGVQLDGDFAGETPMRFSVDAGALLVSVPGGELPAIFSQRTAACADSASAPG